MRLSLIIIISMLSSVTFSQKTEGPTPRSQYFLPKEKVSIKLSSTGDYVGYINPRTTEFIVSKIQPDGSLETSLTHQISSRPGFWQFQPNNDVVIGYPTSQGFEMWHLNINSGSKQKIDMPAQGWVSVNRESNGLVISINSRIEGESGFYSLEKDLSWKKLMPLGDFFRVYFNYKMEPIFASQYQSGDVIFLRKAPTGDWIKIAHYKWPQSFPVDVVSVSKTNNVVYITDNSDSDKTVLVAINTESGQRDVLLEESNADLVRDFAIVDQNTGVPDALVSVFGKYSYHLVNPSIQENMEFLQNQNNGDLQVLGKSKDRNKWLISYFDGGTQEYFLFDVSDRVLTRLFVDNTSLNHKNNAIRSVRVIQTRDGLELPCVLFVPKQFDKDGDGLPDRPIPTVQNVHGGPWIGYYQFGGQFHRVVQLLVNRGYAVMYTEFRGASGYGKEFIDRGNLQWGDKMHDDVIDVGNWLIENGVAPSGQLAIWGVSYGAYASYMALAKQPNMYQCAITKYGPSDLEKFLTSPVADNETWRTRVGNNMTEQGRSLLKDHSPIHLVEDIQQPILMSHGTMDRLAPQEQSDLMAKALHQAGKEFIYVVYPNEGHDYRIPKNNISYWALAEKMLHETIGGNYQPIENDLEGVHWKIMYGNEIIQSWK